METLINIHIIGCIRKDGAEEFLDVIFSDDDIDDAIEYLEQLRDRLFNEAGGEDGSE